MTKKRRAPVPQRVTDTRQSPLFKAAPVEPPAVPAPTPRDDDFVRGDRAKLFFGRQRLDEYLRQSGQTAVLRLVEWLDALDVAPLLADYSTQGRKALHPRLLLGLILYGLTQGVRSLRELETLARINLGALWLCGGEQPDHSTLGKFITRHQDQLGAVAFTGVARQLLRRLPVARDVAAVDGTTVEALASRFQALRAEALRQHAAQAWEQGEHKSDDHTAQAAVAQAQQAVAVLDQRQQERAAKGRTPEETRVAPHEPEAAWQPLKRGGCALSYKPVVLANRQRLVLAQTVVVTAESAAVPGLWAQCQTLFGAPQTLLADGGYHNAAVLTWAVAHDVDALLPAGTLRANGGGAKRSRKGKLTRSEFRYDAARDVYVCPAGATLTRHKRGHDYGGRAVTYYQARANDCAGCALRGRCLRGQSPRTLIRYAAEELSEAMRVTLSHPAARRQYAHRAGAVEPVFAALRDRHGLRRFTRRGLRAARLEFAVVTAAHNLKRGLRLEAALFGWFFCGPDGRRRVTGVGVVFRVVPH